MTWIKTGNWEGDSNLRESIENPGVLGCMPVEYYSPLDMFKEYEPEGSPPAVVMAQSLIPESLKHIIQAYSALLSDELPLSRKDHELIAATVSSLNKTHYCRNYHSFFLKLATGDEELARAVRDDYRTAKLDPRERAMVDYAAKLTMSPSCVERADIEKLKEHGFDDTAITQIAMITAHFAYWNRIADGLGVGRSKQADRLQEPSLQGCAP